MNKSIEVHGEECTGCMACVLTCSFMKSSSFSYGNALMKITRQEAKMINQPSTCSNCEERKCLDSCPVGAIQMNNDLGIPLIDAEICTGCQVCIESCEYGLIKFNDNDGVAVKCDLCGGSPACVEVCIPGALRLISG